MAQKEINNNNNINDNINDNTIVKVHSVLTMVSSNPVNPTGRTCPLSPLDRAMDQHTLHTIFYYRSGSIGFDQIRPSLNKVLTLYPKVLGRLAKDGDGNWEVKFTDTGMRVYLAKVEGSVDEWLRSAGADDEMHLTVGDDFPDDPQFWSPFRMKVTEFEEGGTAIALSCPHMLADPIALTSFIKSWTDTHHRDVITHPPLLHPSAFTNLPKPIPIHAPPSYWSIKSDKSYPKPSLKFGSATFCFSDSTMTKYLSEVSPEALNATPFDLLTALFWSRIVKLKPKSSDCDHKITICMDMRKRLRAPLPSGYFGNAIYVKELSLPNTEMDKPDLGRVMEMVHQGVTSVTEEEFLSAVDWLGSRKDDQGKWTGLFKMYGPELTCVNMEHMIVSVGQHGNELDGQPLMYMASFDKDEKPAHVSYHVDNAEGEGLIMVMPSSEGGLARRVFLMLPEDEIRKIVEDEVIRALNPTMLLTGLREGDELALPFNFLGFSQRYRSTT